MSDEEKRNVEILNNIKEYMQNSIDSGHHKFIYNDLDWDEKCIDIINAIDYFIEKVEQQQNEIEEKTTIIMAGAEKVKQLEKEIQRLEKDNDTLSELVIVNEDKVIKELDLISKDKIRERIKELESKNEENKSELAKGIDRLNFDIIENAKNNIAINVSVRDILKELLEEEKYGFNR